MCTYASYVQRGVQMHSLVNTFVNISYWCINISDRDASEARRCTHLLFLFERFRDLRGVFNVHRAPQQNFALFREGPK